MIRVLRDDIEKKIRWKMSAHPEIQRLFETGELSGVDEKSLLLLYGLYLQGLHEGIRLLADEVDALKTERA